MNWDAIGAIGQVLGSVAVFVTLGYLSVQVRHARQEVRRSISQGRHEAARELCASRANSDRLGAIYAKAEGSLGPQFHPARELADRLGLTREEYFQLHHDIQAWWTYRAQMIPFVSELSEGERFEFDRGTRGFFSHPVNRAWYEMMKGFFNPNVVDYVDKLLAQAR